MPRWAIRVAALDGSSSPTRGLLGSRWNTRGEAVAALRELRAGSWRYRYRLVRLVTRSDRLQRELDQARAAVGAAWLLEGSLADGIRAKCAMLERVGDRRHIVEALLRCTRDDLPPEVDEMVRARVLARDGRDALTSPTVVRETAAILATWIERGAR